MNSTVLINNPIMLGQPFFATVNPKGANRLCIASYKNGDDINRKSNPAITAIKILSFAVNTFEQLDDIY